MVAVLDRPEVFGAQVPRIRVVPDGDEHPLWNQSLELLDKVGMSLDQWQIDILHAAMLRRGDLWAAFTVAVCCPRQNGKNEILQARELIGALVLGEKLLIHSAHLTDTSMESFMRMDDLIESSNWLADRVKHVRRTNGRETVVFTNGSRIRYRTRTRGGGRGFSGSPVIFDEPMFFPVVSQNSILPVMSAQPDPQAWYTGSAVDQTEQEDGIVFARVRERALNGDHDRLAYFEWSLDYPDPTHVPDDVASALASWVSTNPALGIRVTPEYIEAERYELGARGFAVERLGVGDWPATDGSNDWIIHINAWDALADPESSIVGPEIIAFDVSPERRTAVVAAGQNANKKYHVQVLDHRPGTGWLVEALSAMYENREVSVFVCDGLGPSASLVEAIRNAGLPVETVNTPEHGQSCGQLVDLVAQGDLVHLGSDELRDAIRGARSRPLGDAWAWSRKNSAVDISPLVASTLALGQASGIGAALQVF